ncbi:hypothetical protein UFOVP1313_41 [uncultured Caudovirales phage]|uniref:Calcineurin-like phosphoesterase domain-containing protein n=1 Tax=uncultured Caudovirales phage TaxID=2100421 RepID=A0A6J5RWI7_9CAUD|nr:hypothetical protein UFOVP1313_41 [uncultured Caudovirales phage]
MKKKKAFELDAEEVKSLLDQYGSLVAAARGEDLGLSSLRNRASALGVSARDHLKKKDQANDKFLTSDDPNEWGDVKELMKRRGLDPNDWIVTRARVNEWGGVDGQENTQLRVDLAPRLGVLMPARTDGWIAPKPVKTKKKDSELVVFLGDHHAPHHDKRLHEAVCEWLREFKPDRGVILGDLLDFDQLSRHRRTPEWTNDVQETLDAGYGILRAYIEASPNTRWQMLDGNHEDRLRNSVIDHLSSMFGVSQAKEDPAEKLRPVLSTPFLLRLDELGIEWESPDGGYEHAQINITSELAARHGWIATKGSGVSALKTIDHLRYSVIVGHTHRQAIVHHTAHSIDGKPKTLLGCEAGTLATIERGLGYATSPDWQRGFATADVYGGDGGLFKVDLATYVDGSLLWRGWTCKP